MNSAQLPRTPLPEHVAAAIDTVLPALLDAGAVAVLLVGSHVRGDAHPDADVDLIVIGDGPGYRLRRVGGQLLSESWRTAEALQRELLSPPTCAGAVPAMRTARLLHDPDGVAAALQQAALAWTWASIGDGALNAWVANEITGYAEEVHKLVGATRGGDTRKQTIQRSIIALRLAIPLAIHLRLLHDTEHHLWSLVDAQLGPRWAHAQAIALGEIPTGTGLQAAAAGELFALACATIEALLDADQRAVTSHAIALLDANGLRLPPTAN